ncbi:uncharacterized protein NPIL_352941 [Nephila pilipes]|uniref:Uncharacterized protein n=1 Tax=Nephila pilipes TaxID=299642 RepID=A0A8X6PQZ5_NEPPI|nr:uncharacterized protein NPIL_352941 [Nephila pilipes]
MGFLSQKLGVSFMYPDEYHLGILNTDICEESHRVAVSVKNFYYYEVFNDEISKMKPQFESSPLYICDYLSRICGRDGVFSDLSVFELLLTTCAFLIHLCFFCIENGFRKIISCAHLCWAVYFDEYKEDFYRHGGWNQLKILSDSYALVHNLLNMSPGRILPIEEVKRLYILDVMKAMDNYRIFESCFKANYKTSSKAWVKFNLQNLTKSEASDATKDTKRCQDFRNPKVIEEFLLQFRRFCYPNSSEMLKYLSCRRTQSTNGNCYKKSDGTVSRSLLKIQDLTVKDTTTDTLIRQRETEFDSKKNSNQTDDIISTDLFQNSETTSNVIENVAPTNASFSKQISSNEELSVDKTRSPIDRKLNEDTRKEIDLERESPEVKSILRMILVLGNTWNT